MSKLEYEFDPIESALTVILELTDIKREDIEPTLQMLSSIQFHRGRMQEREDATIRFDEHIEQLDKS